MQFFSGYDARFTREFLNASNEVAAASELVRIACEAHCSNSEGLWKLLASVL